MGRGEEGGSVQSTKQKRGAFELNIGWEKSLEGWDAGTNRPVFTLWADTWLLYEKVSSVIQRWCFFASNQDEKLC